jgi:glycosyltransferase involved in cell wall biosynthesis
MITLIVPTRNRAHTLRRVGESFYSQDPVTEIIFVDDGGSDDSVTVIAALATRFPQVRTRILHNDRRRGAAFSRIRGFEQASNDYILFCDDDVVLAPRYAATCLEKLQGTGAAIVSGRLVNKLAHETPEEAVANFRARAGARTPFRRLVCEFKVEAKFDGDIKMPLTHSVILTRKALLQELSYDPFYASGNGYREESDFQMNAFVNGHDILVTNDTHCVELSKQENPSGGQRVSRLSRLYWNVYYTNYFYRKYYSRYARRVGLHTPRAAAIAIFAVYQVYALFVRPLQKLADPEFRRSYWAARASA